MQTKEVIDRDTIFKEESTTWAIFLSQILDVSRLRVFFIFILAIDCRFDRHSFPDRIVSPSTLNLFHSLCVLHLLLEKALLLNICFVKGIDKFIVCNKLIPALLGAQLINSGLVL